MFSYMISPIHTFHYFDFALEHDLLLPPRHDFDLHDLL
jgi:hypothetical protein